MDNLFFGGGEGGWLAKVRVWSLQLVSFPVGLRTYQRPSTCFRHYCVILRELLVSIVSSYTSMLMWLLVIQFKISCMSYAVEISMFKIFKILKLSYL